MTPTSSTPSCVAQVLLERRQRDRRAHEARRDLRRVDGVDVDPRLAAFAVGRQLLLAAPAARDWGTGNGQSAFALRCPRGVAGPRAGRPAARRAGVARRCRACPSVRPLVASCSPASAARCARSALAMRPSARRASRSPSRRRTRAAPSTRDHARLRGVPERTGVLERALAARRSARTAARGRRRTAPRGPGRRARAARDCGSAWCGRSPTTSAIRVTPAGASRRMTLSTVNCVARSPLGRSAAS